MKELSLGLTISSGETKMVAYEYNPGGKTVVFLEDIETGEVGKYCLPNIINELVKAISIVAVDKLVKGLIDNLSATDYVDNTCVIAKAPEEIVQKPVKDIPVAVSPVVKKLPEDSRELVTAKKEFENPREFVIAKKEFDVVEKLPEDSRELVIAKKEFENPREFVIAKKEFDWNRVNWASMRNVDIAKEHGYSVAHVSHVRSRLAPETLQKRSGLPKSERTRKVDWLSIPWAAFDDGTIMGMTGFSKSMVSKMRYEHAKETILQN